VDVSTGLADVIVACTDADGEAWSAIARATPVAVAPNAADVDAWLPSRATQGDPDVFVLFGSLNQDSTSTGATWFLDSVWPEYVDTRPGISLIVAGRNPKDDLAAAAENMPSVKIVSNPVDLVPVVAQAGTVVVPQVWGTGSKLKMAEALASGRRIVASPPATVGLADSLGHWVDVAESTDEWHRLMDAAAAGPRSADDLSRLTEVLTESLSWSASQRQLVTAVKQVSGV
jgi:hypothetical protein